MGVDGPFGEPSFNELLNLFLCLRHNDSKSKGCRTFHKDLLGTREWGGMRSMLNPPTIFTKHTPPLAKSLLNHPGPYQLHLPLKNDEFNYFIRNPKFLKHWQLNLDLKERIASASCGLSFRTSTVAGYCVSTSALRILPTVLRHTAIPYTSVTPLHGKLHIRFFQAVVAEL